MRNRIKRLLTFFIGIGVLILIIVVDHSFISLSLVIISVTILSSLELLQFFKSWQVGSFKIPSRTAAACYGGILVIAAFITINFLSMAYLYLISIFTVSGIFIVAVCIFDDNNPAATFLNIFARLFLVLYPGLFAIFLILLTTLPSPRIVISTFLLAVYGNDGLAYFLGKYIGRRRQKITPVSPKKTLVGFLSGFITSIGVCLAMAFLFPSAFHSFYLGAVILGMLIGASSILGDLVESALKRATGKDNSGDLIPGRGGVLDSIDSCVFSAPFFYYAYLLLFHTL